MTFAEAMALDPNEVEVQWATYDRWFLVAHVTAGFALKDWRKAKFRRYVSPEGDRAELHEVLDGSLAAFAENDGHLVIASREEWTVDGRKIRVLIEVSPANG